LRQWMKSWAVTLLSPERQVRQRARTGEGGVGGGGGRRGERKGGGGGGGGGGNTRV